MEISHCCVYPFFTVDNIVVSLFSFCGRLVKVFVADVKDFQTGILECCCVENGNMGIVNVSSALNFGVQLIRLQVSL